MERIVIAAFGPLFNLLFALAVFTMIWWIGFVCTPPDNRVVLATDYTLDSFRHAASGDRGGPEDRTTVSQ